MAGLLTAEIAAQSAHLFDNVAVADGGAMETDLLARKKTLKPEIRHHGSDQRVAREPATARQPGRDQRHQLIAIEDVATFIGDDQPIGIAIEGNADIGATRQHLAPHLLGRQRSALAIDVQTIGRYADREHLGAEFPEYRRGDLVGGTMGAVDDDTQTIEPQSAGKALLDELDVAAAGVIEALDPAELGGDGAPARSLLEVRFDLQLELVRQLVPVAAEHLDAVVPVGGV